MFKKITAMLTLVFVGFACSGACPVNAAIGAPEVAITYQVKPVYTNITFTIVKWKVFKEEGMFRDFSGTLTYDPEHPERASVAIAIQAASLDTKNSGRDSVVKSDDFLDVQRYPTLAFRSTGVRKVDDSTLEITGDFTLHGTTKQITLQAKLLGVHEVPNVGKLAGFETNFAINRRDYGVLGAKWGAVPGSLSDDVNIHILVGAIRPRE